MRGWGLGVWVAALIAASAAPGQSRDVILATTTSTRDAGLLDTLVPLFERQTGYRLLLGEIDRRRRDDPIGALVRLQHLYRLRRGGLPACWGAGTTAAEADEQSDQNQGSHSLPP